MGKANASARAMCRSVSTPRRTPSVARGSGPTALRRSRDTASSIRSALGRVGSGFRGRLGTADKPGLLQHAQVFGDRLAGQPGSMGQLGDGARLAAAESCDQRETGLVAERGKDRSGCAGPLPGGHAARASGRHASRCSPSAGPIRCRSCGRPRRGGRRESCRSRTQRRGAGCRWRSSPA